MLVLALLQVVGLLQVVELFRTMLGMVRLNRRDHPVAGRDVALSLEVVAKDFG